MDEFRFARAAQIPFERAQRLLPHLRLTCEHWSIDNLPRQAAFISQTAWETQRYASYREKMHYTTAAAIAATWPHRFTCQEERDDRPEHEWRALAVERALPYCGSAVALGNTVYANREGNGDYASGDGFRYRGGGWIHITFKNGYMLAGTALGLPLVDHPELIEQDEHAANTAGWWWQRHGCNALADTGSIDRITRVINGAAMHGRAHRALAYHHALGVLEGGDL